jgi:two-component system, OmpR family, phosphate regulon sensor histidine kinase PhoR
MNFAGRVIVGTVAVSTAAIVALVVGAELALRRDLEHDIGLSLEREARLLGEALPRNPAAWQDLAEQAAQTAGLRVTVIARDGQVVAESERNGVPRVENHSLRPEVAAALQGDVGTDLRRGPTGDTAYLFVAVPGGPGVIRVAAPLAGADLTVRHAQRSLLAASLFAVLIGTLLAFLAARSIASPLTSITAAARSIASGLTPRFPRSGIPEVDSLVRALRDMHDQLDQRFEELRRERAESAALVEAMVEGVIAANPRGEIVTANGAARRLLGYAAEDSLPGVEQLFRGKPARAVVDSVLKGDAVLERELQIDGQHVLLSGRPLPQGGALLVLHDVSELRRLETIRRDFVANVSHELKTPLTSISGYAETLVNDPPDATTTNRFLGVILANARRMQRLVDDLLDLSRIESGRWRPSPEQLDTSQMARDTWALLAGRAAQRHVEVHTAIVPGAERVYADIDALRQVLSNLLDNALRYTPAGGRITLQADRQGKGVLLRVRDTGTGITREHLPRIFERFYRADPGRSREDGGTGLGLSIVKHLVEAHEGWVEAKSEFGRGTEITCWFPDAPETRS